MHMEQAAAAAPAPLRATDILRAQHAGLARLFAQYREGVDGTRDIVARQICAHLRLYSLLEEDVLYPVVRHEAQELVRRAVNAHAALRACIDELAALSHYDPEHEAMMARLIEAAAEHIEEEETRLFPLVEERLPNTLRRIAPDMADPAPGAPAR